MTRFSKARASVGVAFAVFASLASQSARGADSNLRTLPEAALSNSSVSFFSRNAFDIPDFALEWIGSPLSEVKVELAPGSLQWVFALDTLGLPRATLTLVAKGASAGVATYAGVTHPMVVREGTARLEMPVVLLSGERNAINLSLGDGRKGTLVLRFKPRFALPPGSEEWLKRHVYFDANCAPLGLRVVDAADANPDHWMYISCQDNSAQGPEGDVHFPELTILWDNVGQAIKVDGARVDSSLTSVWRVRLKAQQEIELVGGRGGEHRLRLKAFVPERLKRLRLGAGLGPDIYKLKFEGTEIANTVAPMLTLYGSYQIRETLRLVAFDAATIHSNFNNDFGLYISPRSLDELDHRLVVNLLLGGHVMVFRVPGATYLRFAAPQGVEVVYRDFPSRFRTAAFGFFIYPSINEVSYVNAWLRWGSARLFAEVNYIVWHAKLGENNTKELFSRNVAVSVGFPLY